MPIDAIIGWGLILGVFWILLRKLRKFADDQGVALGRAVVQLVLIGIMFAILVSGWITAGLAFFVGIPLFLVLIIVDDLFGVFEPERAFWRRNRESPS